MEKNLTAGGTRPYRCLKIKIIINNNNQLDTAVMNKLLSL